MKPKKLNILEQLLSKIHDHLTQKQFLILSSILVGLSTGIAAVILKSFAHFIRKQLVDQYLQTQDFKLTYVFLPLIGIGITVLIINRFYNGFLSKGISYILQSIAKKSSFIPFHHMWAHIITSGITVGFGGSGGMEAPIVNTGSAIGSNYARRYKLSYRERTLLLAAGAAGGIAGAFNAPIAGVLFALEVLLIDINLTAFIPLLIASASGALISKIILNENILLNFKLKQPFNYENLPFYVALALLSAAVALYYVNVFSWASAKFKKLKSKSMRWLIGSLLLAVLLLLFPTLFGEGYESIKGISELHTDQFLNQSVLKNFVDHKWQILILICLTFLLKSVAVALTIGSGGNCGNFAPSLFVGAHLGFAFALLLQYLGFKDVPVVNFTLVAMAGVLAGVFHAPLTSIFLIAEITGGYELIIPLMIVSSVSYAVVKYFHPDSLDVLKLKKKGTVVSEDKDTSILGKIDMSKLIETDFTTLKPNDNLGVIVENIKHSQRNIFPVVDENNKLQGIITMAGIKEEMFNQELYTKLVASEIMLKPEVIIKHDEDIFSVMDKFEETGQWNLPVTEKGVYKGFLSKSSILTEYREQLLSSI
ncbi:MAG: chloride channel protein [Bacteroidota bacterium]|nr:chloride channel protein [Bacteroidota bacterium]